jgi:hypothetical protein
MAKILGEVRALFETCGMLIYLVSYPMLIIWLLIKVNLGVYGWIIIGLCLTPPTLAWYIIASRRLKNYLRSLTNKEPKEWDVEKAVREYLEVLKREKSRKDESEK